MVGNKNITSDVNGGVLGTKPDAPAELSEFFQVVVHHSGASIEKIDDYSIQLSGTETQVELAKNIIYQAIDSASTQPQTGLDYFTFSFNQIPEDSPTIDLADYLSSLINPDAGSENSEEEDDEEDEDTRNVQEELDLRSLNEFFSNNLKTTLLDERTGFEKPVLESDIISNLEDLTSYRILNQLTDAFDTSPRFGTIDFNPPGGPTFIPNDPPVAVDDVIIVLEGQTLSIYEALLANDLDTETLTILSISDPTLLNGTITFDSAGRTFLYEAGAFFDSYAVGESYTEFFLYTIVDSAGSTFEARVTVTVVGVNDIPVAQNDIGSIANETDTYNGNVLADNGNGADSDVDTSDVLSVVGVTGGSVGVPIVGSTGGLFTINSDGSVSFDPNGDFDYLGIAETADTVVEYTIGDGNGGTDTATLTITVSGVDNPPIARDDDYSILESDVINSNVFLDNGNGIDDGVDTSDTFSVIAVSGGTVGSASAGSNGGLFTINSDGTVNFNPNGDFEYLAVGETIDTTIQYTISDVGGATSTATVTVTLTGENDNFTGNDDNVSINENVTLNIHPSLLSNDTDIDTSDVLNIIAVDSSGTNGTVSFNDATNTLNYTASNYESLAVGQTATDTLIYTLTDGHGATQDVNVTIIVTGVNDAPVAQDDAGTIDEDSTFSTNVFNDNGSGADSDIDTGDVLSVSAVSGGSVGSASAGSNGGLFTINADGSTSFDPNGDFEDLAVGETRDTTVQYTVSDGNGGTDTATLTITVTGVNDTPVGNVETISVNENDFSANLHTLVLSNDTDVDASDTLDISGIDTSLTTGFVTYNDAANILLYSAQNYDYLAEGATATDSFVYTVSDGNGGTQSVTVTVNITGVNDAPTAQEDLFTTDEDTITSGNVLVDNGNGADSDADIGDTVSVNGVVGGSLGVAIAGDNGGLFTINADGSISFNPNNDFEDLAIGDSRETVVYYTAVDNNGAESVGTVTMTVTGANDAPIAQDDALSVGEDNTYNGNVLIDNGSGADSDPDNGDTLSVSGVVGGSLGVAIAGSNGGLFTINADGTINFDSNSDFEDLAVGETRDTTVQYTVSDGNGGTDTATVTMTVNGANDAPNAVDDSVNTIKDTVYNGNVLIDNLNGADTDPDTSDTLSVSGVVGGSLGVAVAGSNGGLFTINADGTFSFDPNGDFDGLASAESQVTTIQYIVSDGNGGTDTATITMSVTGGSLAAEDDGLIGELAENGETYIIDESVLLANDVTAGALTIDIISMDADVGQGSLVNNNDGTWTYTSPADSLAFLGIANITYTAEDSAGSTDTATFQLRVFNTITGTAAGDIMVAEDNDVPHKFIGLAGNDTITGSNTRDLLIGGADDDDMDGGDGDDDFIFEGTGNGVDTIDGGLGTDRVIGSTGDDTLTVLNFLNIEEIDLGTGTDTLLGTAGDDDFIFGSAVITDLDAIDGGAGTNRIIGTAGDDSYDLSNVTSISNISQIDMGTGNDTLIGSTDNDTIYINAGDNSLSGNDGDDTFLLDASATGSNIIDGGIGNDQILGTAGDDALTLNTLISIEFIDLGLGTNSLRASEDGALDLSAYTLGVDLLGVSYITDNIGTETVTGTDQDDEIYMEADENADTFNGRDGDDTFRVSGAVNGGDIVDGGIGNDQILGSAENDSLTLSSITSIEYIDLGAGTDFMRASEDGALDLSAYTVGVDLLGLENIRDNIGTETVTGTDQDDEIRINADANADTFDGRDGDDVFIFSGNVEGGDIVDGGLGTDQLLGSSGDDLLILSTINSIEYIDFGNGTDVMQADRNGTLDISAYTVGVDLLGLETITDNDGTESVTGTDQADTILIQSDSNADTFDAGGGDDSFTFSGTVDGSDSVDGGTGTNTITGSTLSDNLILATLSNINSLNFLNGNDTFYINASMNFTGMTVNMGNDTDYLSAQAGATMDLSSYTMGVEFLNVEFLSDNMGGSETVIGTDQANDIVMRADTHADTFEGRGGDDIFRVSGNVNRGDSVDGGSGTDQIIGSTLNDRLLLSTLTSIESISLGAGSDGFYINESMDFTGMTIDMGSDTDFLAAQQDATMDLSSYTMGVDFISVEYITDNTGTETVIGSDQADDIRMTADTRADTFEGRGGDDIFRISGNVNRNDSVDGGSGTDQIIGSSCGDILQLSSITGIESVDFGDGNDGFIIRAGMADGSYTIDMGDGTDYIQAQTNNVLDISAYTLGVDLLGLEYITDNTGSETVIGTNQADDIRIRDDASTDSFFGLGGDDVFTFSGSVNRNDRIDGGEGTDRIVGSAGNDSLTLADFISIEIIDFGAGTDFMQSETNGTLDISAYTLGVDLLGLDYITDNNGSETITGTDQDDEIRIVEDASTDVFYGNDGDDTFRFSGDINRNDRIYGGQGTDQLLGSSGDDSLTLHTMDSIEFIDFGAGTDFIQARSGATLDISAYTRGVDLLGLEYITDNTGSETITGTDQDDDIRIVEDVSADTFNGGDGDDIFRFGGDIDQNDIINGGLGTDSVIGSSGDDVLQLSSLTNIDSLDFGNGNDVFLTRAGMTDGSYTIDMGGGTDYMMAQMNNTLNISAYTLGVDLLGLEYITDNTGSETIVGTDQADEIRVRADASTDSFSGGGGDDTFVINGHITTNDSIDGGSGTDQIIGSGGSDSLTLSSMTSIEFIDLGGGTDYIRSIANGSLDISAYTLGVDLLGLEYITDNTGTETITGTDQADELRMRADTNADTFNGGNGDDVFTFFGAVNGGDIINGGAGTNTVTGSSGNDILHLSALSNISSIDFGDGNDGFTLDASISLVGVSVDMGIGTDYIQARIGQSLDLSAYTLGVDILGLEYITDNTGTETIAGTDQADELRMRADTNADTFNGGNGDDVFTFSGAVNGGDIIDGGAGTNTVTGSSGNDILNLTALSNVSSIDFGDGDDGFIISSAISFAGMTIDMGIGTDYIQARADNSLNLSAYTLGVDILGLEYISDNSGTETITGTDQADEIRMNADTNADTFNGGNGDDVFTFSGAVNGGDIIDGGAGTNTVTGSSGNDILRLGAISNVTSIDFGDGNDGFVLDSSLSLAGISVDMGIGTDYIQVRYEQSLNLSAYTLGVDILGLEYLTDSTGTETLTGTDQADEIRMNADIRADTFNGGGGDDVFTFSGSVTGGDIIDGGTGTNTVTGSSGNDFLRLGAISNVTSIDFGDGNDGFILDAGLSLAGITVDFGTGTDYIQARLGQSLDLSAYTLGVDFIGLEYITDNTNAETITGTDQADEIRMSADGSADTFNGGGGDDVFTFSGSSTSGDIIDGGTGTNTVTGSSGNDTLYLGAFSNIDSIDFGGGSDTFILNSSLSLAGISVDMGAGIDYIQVQSGQSLDLSAYTLGVDITGLEYITDNSGTEELRGTNQADQIALQADGNSDDIYGNNGADVFTVLGQLTAADNLADFNTSQGDVINIADILSYDSANGDDILDFIQFTDSGDGNPSDGSGVVTISVDVDGTDNGTNFQDYFIFSDQGLDLNTLIGNGNLIVE